MKSLLLMAFPSTNANKLSLTTNFPGRELKKECVRSIGTGTYFEYDVR